MYAYCVGELRFSEDAAYKRIQAARAARQFPAFFAALAEGRLHLTGLGLLAPHLTAANADDLLAAATHKTKSEIELLLAERFPRTELLPLVQVIPASPFSHNAPLAPAQVEADTGRVVADDLTPEHVVPEILGCVGASTARLAPAQVASEVPGRVGASATQLAPAQVEAPVPRPSVKPLAPERFALQFTIGKDTYDKLRHIQALLSHRLPSGDVAQVFDRALDALMGQLEKQKFAATQKPRPHSRRSSDNLRHIPAHVKRTVWERDQGRCTFVSKDGKRCPARELLEFDHIEPVARGGRATVEGVRLRCRGHNQYEAERVFGAGFMVEKREEARRVAAERRRLVAVAETG